MRFFYCLHVGARRGEPMVIDIGIDITPFLVEAQMTFECSKSREVRVRFRTFWLAANYLTFLKFPRTM
jgi:hypothetical protein